MLILLKKSKYIFISLLFIYVIAFMGGYVFGKLQMADAKELLKNPVTRLSMKLEYKVPGYGHILKAYKSYHDQKRNSYLSSKNYWAIGILIFLNNFIVANISMILRAVFVLPVTLNAYGKFVQGAIFSQTPMTLLFWGTFIMEFGGYFLTICGALSFTLWAIFYRSFNFSSRREAACSGLKLLGYMYLISGIAILLGSIFEVIFLRGMMLKFI